MVKTRQVRKTYKKEATRTQPLRCANNSLRSDTNVCEVMNKKAIKTLRKNKEVFVTNISNQTKNIKGDVSYHAYSSADLYIDQKMFDINPRSKVFKSVDRYLEKNVLLCNPNDEVKMYNMFNDSIVKRWVVVKIGLVGHYAVALIDQYNKKVEFFDSGGIHENWIIDKVKILFGAIKPDYKLNIVQQEAIQEADDDRFCQTWIWVWLYFRLEKKLSHTQFKRIFQPMTLKERTKAVLEAHYYLIN